MVICFGCDNNYVQQTGIAILSLLENNRNTDIEQILLLNYGIVPENQKILQDLVNSYRRKLVIIEAAPIMADLNRTLGLANFGASLATYSRAFIDRLVPDSIDRLLYLDSDIVVSGSLEKLAKFNMENKAMACVIGNSQYRAYKNVEIDLLSGNRLYFQCGVVLYNLTVWRREKCTALTMKTCKSMKTFRNADQTLINNAIPEALISSISPKYNYWGHIYPKHREYDEMQNGGFWSKELIDDAIAHPVIVHYKSAYFRPWIKGSMSRLNDLWHDYNEKSPWRDVPLKKWKDSIPYPKTGRFRILRAYHPIIVSAIPYSWMSRCLEKMGNIIFCRKISPKK